MRQRWSKLAKALCIASLAVLVVGQGLGSRLLTPTAAVAANADWYNSSWQNRKAITVDNSSGLAKTNYQVKVELTSSNFDFAKAKSDGTDIRFTSSDGTTLLDFWRQDYDNGAETGTFWVEVPSIADSGSATIYIYYNNSGASDASSGADTFPNGFEDWSSPFSHIGYTADRDEIQLENVGKFSNPIIAVGGSGSWKSTHLREPGNPLNVSALSLSLNGTTPTHILLYTGYDGSNFRLGLSLSDDNGATWEDWRKSSTNLNGPHSATDAVITLASTSGLETNDYLIFDPGGGNEEWKQIQSVDSGTQVTLTSGLTNNQSNGTVVHDNSPILTSTGDDAYIAAVGTTIHLYAESAGGGGSANSDINHYTWNTASDPSDPTAWTADTNNPIVARQATTWKSQKVGSPTVFLDPDYDSSGNKTAWMFMDGNNADNEQTIGLYKTTDVTAADQTWTEVLGPLLIHADLPSWTGNVVPTETYAAGGTRYLIFHDGGTGGIMSATDTPSSWTTSSFDEHASPSGWIFTNNVVGAGPDLTLVDADTGVAVWDARSNGIYSGQFLGKANRRFGIAGGDALPQSSGVRNPINNPVTVEDNSVLWEPSAASTEYFQYVRTTDFTLTTGFAVRWYRRSEGGVVADDQFEQLSIGSGGITTYSDKYRGGFDDGYQIEFGRANGTTSSALYRVDNAAKTSLNTATISSSAHKTSRNAWEWQYWNDGVNNNLRLVDPDGNTELDADDATYTGSKQLVFLQGQRNDDRGAHQTLFEVMVRTFDGSDPAITLAAEESAPVSSTPTPTPTPSGSSDNTETSEGGGGPVASGDVPLVAGTTTADASATTSKGKTNFTLSENQALTIATKPVDADQLQELRLSVNGKTYYLTDKSADPDNPRYEVTLPGFTSPGVYPYSLTADYGTTTSTVKGVILVEAKKAEAAPAPALTVPIQAPQAPFGSTDRPDEIDLLPDRLLLDEPVITEGIEETATEEAAAEQGIVEEAKPAGETDQAISLTRPLIVLGRAVFNLSKKPAPPSPASLTARQSCPSISKTTSTRKWPFACWMSSNSPWPVRPSRSFPSRKPK